MLTGLDQKSYQPTTNTVKDEKGCLVADPHSILARWMNHFSQPLNVHGFDVRPLRMRQQLKS
jgi:hypothetical protein